MNTKLLQSEKRIGVACEECRKRKRKCDGLRPTCTSCATSQRDCQYAGTVETRKRKQWDAEYVSALEDQIATLRTHLADLQHTKASPAFSSSTEEHENTFQPSPSSVTAISTVSTKDLQQSKADLGDMADLNSDLHPEAPRLPGSDLCVSAIEDLGSLVWRLSIGDVGEPAFIGPSGNFCIPSSVGAVVSHSTIHDIPHGTANREFSHHVSIKRSLCNLFMVQLNPIHQFIRPSTVLTPDLYPFEDSALNVLYGAIMAAGALYSNVEEEREAGTVFASYVDGMAVKICRQQPSVIVVQALSILAWRELSQEHNNLAWIYASMAGGLAVGLGLHVIGLEQLSDASKALLDYERETRLRTFWSFFLIDRIATSVLGRSSIIPWRRVEVPTLDYFLDNTASIEEVAFSHQCKLWQLHDKYMDQIYAFDFDALEFAHRYRLLLSARAAILAFRQNMSPQLQISTSSSNTSPHPAVIFLQMSYQMSLLLIHRPYLREPPDSSSFNIALITMSSAATRMTHYIQLFYKYHLQHKSTAEVPSAPPFIIHHILTASIMHLLNGTVPNYSQRGVARRRLQICMEVLSVLQINWSSASKAIAQIQELAVQWKIVGVLPLKWSFVVGEVPIITHSSPDRRSYNTKSSLNIGGDSEVCHEAAKKASTPAVSKGREQPMSEMSAFGTTGTANWSYKAPTGNMTSGLDYTFEPESISYQGTSELEYNLFLEGSNLTNDDVVLPHLDPRFYPDYSALQDVFNIHESWGAF